MRTVAPVCRKINFYVTQKTTRIFALDLVNNAGRANASPAVEIR